MAQAAATKNLLRENGKGEIAGQSFKKGHRRAHSMPSQRIEKHPQRDAKNSQRGEETDPTQEEAKRETKGSRKLRYRHILIPSARKSGPDSKSQRKQPEFDVIEVLEDESDFEVPNVEEAMMHLQGVEQQDGDEGQSESHRRHKRFWQLNWKRVHFTGLPAWLQDNEFLYDGHRPQLGSFGSCFKSIFSLHTETGNIWTHMYGSIAFLGAFVWFLCQPRNVIAWPDKLIFSFFFIGAILCMGLSFAFHTVQCHSEDIGRLFSKLDYSGISLLIIGSFVPWLYYAFYCRTLAMSIYIGMIVLLGVAAVVVSLWDKFAQPKFRPLRAGVFLAMGLSSVAPALHLAITDGFRWMFDQASFHWMLMMGGLYIAGATIYMIRFPERCCPGRCDILCHSHQLFHLFVIFAAAVHYHGVLEMAKMRLEGGSCSEQLIERSGTDAGDVQWIDAQIRPY